MVYVYQLFLLIQMQQWAGMAKLELFGGLGYLSK